MNWKEKLNSFEEDTLRIVEISRYFLIEYHDCSDEEVDALIADFFDKYGSRADEDYVHFALSYRLAALIYFTMKEDYSFGEANQEIINRNLHNPPDEAMLYFRNNYFDDYRNDPFKFYPFTNKKRED